MIRSGTFPALLALLIAAPAIAQSIEPPPGMPLNNDRGPMRGPDDFGTVSPAGKAVLRQAMRSQADRAEWQKLKNARDQVAVILSAEKLDVPALKSAMEQEQTLVAAQHARRQAAMLDAFQKLSAADRKAFVEDARRGRQRLERMVRPYTVRPAGS